MKLKLLPSTFGKNGVPSQGQHLTCIVIDDRVAFDAGSLAMAANDVQRDQIRDIVLSHGHLDHIAGLPIFIDDLFASLTEPIRIHASSDVIEILEHDIFNWRVYPRFSELSNDSGAVIQYVEFETGRSFVVKGLQILPLEVNHKVTSHGFIISDNGSTIAITGDTAQNDDLWRMIREIKDLDALLIECSFPDSLSELASVSHHLTPKLLAGEIAKLGRPDCRIFVTNIKPFYRDETIGQIKALNIEQIEIFEIGKDYVF